MFIVNPYIYSAAFTNDYSLLFDGVDEYVTMGANIGITSTTPFSMSAWVKADTVSGNDTIIGRMRDVVNDGYVLYLFNGKPRFAVSKTWVSNAAAVQGNSTTLLQGVWYHVVATYDGSKDVSGMNIYVNGVAETLGTVSNNLTGSISQGVTEIFNVGKAQFADSYFDGNIDEPAFFDYELTSGQVTSLYNSGTPTDLDNTSGVTAPVHWWRMGDGDTFPTINDVGTTGGNNGTMTNMEAGDIVSDAP
jgi:hypothetical protein